MNGVGSKSDEGDLALESDLVLSVITFIHKGRVPPKKTTKFKTYAKSYVGRVN